MATTVTITKADNQLVMFLDRKLIYSRDWDGSGDRNEVVDITQFLVSGASNILVIAGINWGGPYEFVVTVKRNGNELGHYQSKGTPTTAIDGYGVPWNQAVHIPL